MTSHIESKPRAIEDLKAITRDEARRIIDKIESLKNDLAGDVKRLTHFTPEYRLRTGSYRALSEVEGAIVVIYRVRHRKDAYSCEEANMIELHPEIIEKDGKKQFVVLTYEEFLAIEEALADADDLTKLRAAKKDEHDTPTITLERVVEELELKE